jgi:hypothetical protein
VNEKLLEALASTIIPEEETIKAVPHIEDYEFSQFQVIPKEGAVALNPATACVSVELKPDRYLKDDSLLRIMVSVGFISRVMTGSVDLEDWFKRERSSFLKPIAKNYDLSKIKIVYKQPNRGYFKLLDNANAYEFRVYVKYIGD